MAEATGYHKRGRIRIGNRCHIFQTDKIDGVLAAVFRIFLQADGAACGNHTVKHQVGFVVNMPRCASAGIVLGRRFIAVQPGVPGGQLQRFFKLAIHVHVQSCGNTAASGRVGNGEACHQGVGLLGSGKFHIGAGVVQSDCTAAGGFTGEIADCAVGREHLGTAASHRIFRLVQGVGHAGTAQGGIGPGIFFLGLTADGVAVGGTAKVVVGNHLVAVTARRCQPAIGECAIGDGCDRHAIAEDFIAVCQRCGVPA